MKLFGMVDRVLGNLDCHIGLSQKSLATQAGLWLKPPGAVQQIFLALVEFIEGAKALSHNDMASGAGATQIAGMFDVDLVVEQSFTDGSTGRCRDFGALGTILGVGKNFDDGHGVDLQIIKVRWKTLQTDSMFFPAKAF